MEECRQLTMFGEEIPREPPEVQRDRDGKFLPGSSGNPSGRRKPTWEEREALEEIKKLAPGVAGRMTKLLDNEKTPANVKVRIMEIILERTYGKPEAAIKLKAEMESGESSRARLEAIAARCRAVCFGSLAQRNVVSRETIKKFLEATPADCMKIFDIVYFFYR